MKKYNPIIIIAVIALVGYFVYERFVSKDDTKGKENTNTTATATPSTRMARGYILK